MASFAEDHEVLWRNQFPLRTKGRNIVNKYGDRFKFVGVNWYGASDSIHVVCGLTTRSLNEICANVASMGFNVVRLPFSNEMLSLQHVPKHAIDYKLNPTLIDKTPLEVYDEVIDCLGIHGVTVVLNNHTTVGMWSGGIEPNGLWFVEGSTEYTENSWVSDWVRIAKRYEEKPWVVGYDLRNEVRPVNLLRKSKWPLWGRLGENRAVDQTNSVDWRRASGRCAEALVSRGFPGLIIVERLAWPQDPLNHMLSPSAPWEPNLTSADVHVSREDTDEYANVNEEVTPDEVITLGAAYASQSIISQSTFSSRTASEGSITSTFVTSTRTSTTTSHIPYAIYDTTPSGWHKVPKDRVVLALHVYAWSGPSTWSPKHFTGGIFKSLLNARDWMSGLCLYGEYEREGDLEKQMDIEFGWVLQQDICPVWVSEFGSDLNSEYEMNWFRKMCGYMEKHSVDFAYWPLNVGMKPTHEPSADTSNEGYGLLTNDWEPRWHDERLRLLRNMIPVQVSRHAPYSLTSSLSPPTYIDTRIPLVLLASPWCYPLPGPLTDWDNCSIPHVDKLMRVDAACGVHPLPESRYDWKHLVKGIQTKQEKSERIEQAKRRCISGGFGGFTVEKGEIIYQNMTCETLYVKALELFLNADDVYICYELKVCGDNHRSVVSIGLETYESQDVYMEENAEILQFDMYNNLLSSVSINPSYSSSLSSSTMNKDAISINPLNGRSVNLGICKSRCLSKGYGGFAVDGRDGTAYFRSCNDASVLRKGLKKTSKHTTFYILTVSSYTIDDD